MTTPEPPVGVQLVYADETTSDELPPLYVGDDVEGMHQWEVLAPDHRVPRAVRMRTLPGRTTVLVVLQ